MKLQKKTVSTNRPSPVHRDRPRAVYHIPRNGLVLVSDDFAVRTMDKVINPRNRTAERMIRANIRPITHILSHSCPKVNDLIFSAGSLNLPGSAG